MSANGRMKSSAGDFTRIPAGEATEDPAGNPAGITDKGSPSPGAAQSGPAQNSVQTQAQDQDQAPSCPLCGGHAREEWRDKIGQPYYLCGRCALIYLHPARHPSRESEHSRYLEHNNSADNPGYVDYLTDFAEHAIFPYLPSGSRILDFGSGPAPVLTAVLNERGYKAESYDPYFAPDTALQPGAWDAVAAVEVAEHLFDPAGEFTRLRRLLRPGGFLFLRTELHDGTMDFFSRWWYRRDRTHVVFYCPETLRFISRAYGLRLRSCMRGKEIVFSS